MSTAARIIVVFRMDSLWLAGKNFLQLPSQGPEQRIENWDARSVGSRKGKVDRL